MNTSFLEKPAGRISEHENFDYTLDYLKLHNVDIAFDNADELKMALESIFSVSAAEKDKNVLSEIACRGRQGEIVNFGLSSCAGFCIRAKADTAPYKK